MNLVCLLVVTITLPRLSTNGFSLARGEKTVSCEVFSMIRVSRSNNNLRYFLICATQQSSELLCASKKCVAIHVSIRS